MIFMVYKCSAELLIYVFINFRYKYRKHGKDGKIDGGAGTGIESEVE